MDDKTMEARELKARNGYAMMFSAIAILVLSILGFVLTMFSSIQDDYFGALMIIGVGQFAILPLISIFMFIGLKIVKPNEAYVFSLFGKYYGTLSESGFWWVNPFVSANTGTANEAASAAASSEISSNVSQGKSPSPATVAVAGRKTVSLKVQTFANGLQKVNDKMGNPIMIGAIVVWKISDPTKAVFVVDNYKSYLNNQADSIIRNVSRLFPYDSMSDGDDTNDEDEVTLRGSSANVACLMKDELQDKVQEAGIEILDVRINQLSYAEEIASAMLQRQQAAAVIAARRKIVEGAVSMVEMALDQLKSDGVVDLDEERKAQMVSNLLVVLCGSKDAQPVVNSGSVY